MGDSTEEYFLSESNCQSSLKKFYDSIDLGVEFKLQKEINKNPKSFSELLQTVFEDLPENGTEFKEILEFMRNQVLLHSCNVASPYAMAFPDHGNSVAALSASIIADFANQNLMLFQTAGLIATVMELVVLSLMRELVGYPLLSFEGEPVSSLKIGGICTTGGVASNTIALLLAKEKMFPGGMKKGITGIPNQPQLITIIPKGLDHYSSRLSAGWLGLGEDNVLEVPTKNFKYDLKYLEAFLSKLYKKGEKVIMLTAYAGDSRSMTCDNFPALRKICDRYGIWLHADACNGMQVLFSDKLKSILKGIELADSITMDPHKVLGIPYQLSILLTKHPEAFLKIRRQFQVLDDEPYSFGTIMPFLGSRPWMSLKMYMLLKHVGKAELGKVIEKRCKMAKLLGRKISSRKDFTLINPEIAINAVMFMYTPLNIHWRQKDYIAQLNRLNKTIQENLLKFKNIWLHSFEIPDSNNIFGLGEKIQLRVLRFMSGNPTLTEEHLDEMLNGVVDIGQKIQFEGTISNEFYSDENNYDIPAKRARV